MIEKLIKTMKFKKINNQKVVNNHRNLKKMINQRVKIVSKLIGVLMSLNMMKDMPNKLCQIHNKIISRIKANYPLS